MSDPATTHPSPTFTSRLAEAGEGIYLKLCRRYQVAKILFFAGIDALLLAASIVASYWFLFDGHIPSTVWKAVGLAATLSVAVKLPVFGLHGLYRHSWSQVGFDDILRVAGGVTIGTVVFFPFLLLVHARVPQLYVPRMLIATDYMATLLFVGAFRLLRRTQIHLQLHRLNGGTRALIVGAGATGEHLVVSLRKERIAPYVPVGFVDDAPGKLGAVIRGVRVVGTCEELPNLVGAYGARAVLIAMPSAGREVIRSVITAARDAGVQEIRIVPGLHGMLQNPASANELRDVELVDLLGRKPVEIDFDLVERWLSGRRVLVTGAAGSIGSELCRQLARFPLAHVILLDIDETGLFWAAQEMRRLGLPYTARIEDVRNERRMRDVLLELRPDVVFHAAAYKHVHLMEQHPEQAVSTNILGTLAVLRAADAAGVGRFVLISTDKAVRPTSVMGVTKRVSEMLCLSFNQASSMRCLAVRFGNVLGSRGSVVPIFQDQIRRGEPLTVRGENTRRFFMAVSEAVLLVLCAGALAEGGDVFVLDMGEPIRIVDLARELIRLSGLRPHVDVPIVFENLRPGEKEYEELLTAEEGTLATRHECILVARRDGHLAPAELLVRAGELQELVDKHDSDGIVRLLQRLVPTFEPSAAILGRAAWNEAPAAKMARYAAAPDLEPSLVLDESVVAQ